MCFGYKRKEPRLQALTCPRCRQAGPLRLTSFGTLGCGALFLLRRTRLSCAVPHAWELARPQAASEGDVTASSTPQKNKKLLYTYNPINTA